MIFVGYTHRLGRVDHESIENYRKNKDVERVVIFCRIEPSKEIEDLFKSYEVIVTENPRKEAKRFAKEMKKQGKKVEVFDLQDFGERAIRDTC